MADILLPPKFNAPRIRIRIRGYGYGFGFGTPTPGSLGWESGVWHFWGESNKFSCPLSLPSAERVYFV